MDVLVTAEIRWLAEGEVPLEVVNWFEFLFSESDQHPARVDQYLHLPDCEHVGVKLREGRLEIKAQEADLGARNPAGSVMGTARLWRKWSWLGPSRESAVADLTVSPSWIPVHKERRIGWLGGSQAGGDTSSGRTPTTCSVELTRGSVLARPFWTVGFEASGDETKLVSSLDQALGWAFSERSPSLPLIICRGYPAFLGSFTRQELS